jgi:hypothetical protein
MEFETTQVVGVGWATPELSYFRHRDLKG